MIALHDFDLETITDEMTPEAMAHYDNGCGPGWLPPWAFPDGPFCSACAKHDLLYAAGGTHAQFVEVERIFRRELRALAIRATRWRLFWVFVALAYGAHTRTFGYHTSWRKDFYHLSIEQLEQRARQ
jgi:hypothetical protein